MSLVHIRILPSNMAIRAICATNHWVKRYPHLAAFLAGDMSENSGVEAVNDELMASEEEAARAERQLCEFGLRLAYDMGYHKLMPMPHALVEGPEFMPEEIAGRYY